MAETQRERVTAGDVEDAVGHAVEVLGAGTERNWSVRAGDLTWTCRRTGTHIADCLIAYAMQVLAQPADHWVPSSVGAPRTATPEGLLELIDAGGKVLATTVRSAPATVRAWHPYGVSDPEGFAAMGVVEVLIHGDDIAAGLGLPFEAPADLSRRTLARLFPDVGGDDDPWTLLRWACGRIALPERPRRRAWRWHGAPLG